MQRVARLAKECSLLCLQNACNHNALALLSPSTFDGADHQAGRQRVKTRALHHKAIRESRRRRDVLKRESVGKTRKKRDAKRMQTRRAVYERRRNACALRSLHVSDA